MTSCNAASAARDKAGRTLLHTAVLYGNVEVVKFLVDQYPHLINTTDNVSLRIQSLDNQQRRGLNRLRRPYRKSQLFDRQLQVSDRDYW